MSFERAEAWGKRVEDVVRIWVMGSRWRGQTLWPRKCSPGTPLLHFLSLVFHWHFIPPSASLPSSSLLFFLRLVWFFLCSEKWLFMSLTALIVHTDVLLWLCLQKWFSSKAYLQHLMSSVSGFLLFLLNQWFSKLGRNTFLIYIYYLIQQLSSEPFFYNKWFKDINQM